MPLESFHSSLATTGASKAPSRPFSGVGSEATRASCRALRRHFARRTASVLRSRPGWAWTEPQASACFYFLSCALVCDAKNRAAANRMGGLHPYEYTWSMRVRVTCDKFLSW